MLYSVVLQNDRTEMYLDGIRKQHSPHLQMVVAILPTNRKDRYDAIKKLCCLETPGIKLNIPNENMRTGIAAGTKSMREVTKIKSVSKGLP